MKIFSKNAMTVVLSTGYAMGLVVNAAPAIQPDKTDVIRSVFILPASPKEGRDPFFPDSNRPYAVAVVAKPRVADISSLVVKGFSGLLDHRLVIINNHTFAAGDEGDVIVPLGRIHVRCIEIKTNSVVIEVGGQRHELFYSNQP
ncbi:MAG: hypothetical protein WBN22_04995 [Verrucomicrobiia bacterium]